MEGDLEKGSPVSTKDEPTTTNSGGGDLFLAKKYQTSLPHKKEYTTVQTLLLAFQSLGIVYGDIGTSPLYVLSSVGLKDPTEDDLLGILSLIFWTLTIIPLIKYVFIVLRADDHGEGGTFALYSYLCRHINFKSELTIQSATRLESDANMSFYTQGEGSAIKSKTKTFIENSKFAQNFLTFVVLLGTSMVIGDGALTPATSVLSALAGIQSLSSKITTGHVVVLAVVILLALFLFQRFGTSKVGFSFSPIMFLWFAALVVIGIYNIAAYNPAVLKGLSPHYIIKFFKNRGKGGWEVLGAVFLCTTGAEAMFADLGHFNKRSIQMAFSFFVYPSLVVCYAGEVAFITKNPGTLSTAFYSSIPKPVYWPMFVLATLAATIASQSMISATFSIVKQSLALGCFPRVNIKQTSAEHEGQVYSPEINYILMIICIALVLTFRQGVEIGNAYGVAVIWVMIITTCLVTLVMLIIWDTKFPLILAFFVPFIFIEGTFMTSLLNKIPQGGWVPFAIAAFFLIIMMSWTSGRSKKTAFDAERKMSMAEFSKLLSATHGELYRPPGICFFCTDLVNGIPPIVRHYIQSTNSLREITVIVTIRTLPIKTVLPEERLDVGRLAIDGVYRCLIQFGYKDAQSFQEDDIVASIIASLKEIAETEEEKEKLQRSFEKGVVFVAGRTILKSKESNGWLSRLVIDYFYRFLQKNCRSALTALRIPPGKFLQVGMHYEI
ncbi:OLC1v1027582C1 [Oldenlandia corymbosa var. corymbosa]|nr:OLC1v1027582C1 [Oldenlandia corymbosa var. corymbosa]